MTKRVLKAIDSSIAHWERMLEKGITERDLPTQKHCALCRMFVLEKECCDDCPVARKSGEDYCRGTPYYDADEALRDWHRGGRPRRAPVRKELNFLKSVRKWYIKRMAA